MGRTALCIVCRTRPRPGLSFFRFPKRDNSKRRAWVKAVKRHATVKSAWSPKDNTRICARHFVDAWHADSPSYSNYRPTLFGDECDTSDDDENQEAIEDSPDCKRYDFSLFSHSSYCAPDISHIEHAQLESEPKQDVRTYTESGVQCVEDPVLEENCRLKKENERLREELKKQRFSVESIRGKDEKTKFYTGLPSFAIFLWLFEFLKPKAQRMTYWVGQKLDYTAERQRSSTGSLILIDQLFAVLVRLRLGLFVSDISDRFQIAESTFSKYFTTWIALLSTELKVLNPFPSREIVNLSMPDCFKVRYPTVRVILDCTEVFIQRSSSLVNQSMTFSSYKHHTTAKFLVGITPSGIISFVSEGWPGKTSDRQLTIESGILELLDSNDSVMADKGFTIRDVLAAKKCTLNIPPFRGSSAQFTAEEVLETQHIANLRIHVERSIGRVKNFHILDGIMPLTLQPLIDRIFQVCCWLTNLDVPLVK